AAGGAGLVIGSLATKPLVRVLSVEDLLWCGVIACAGAALLARTFAPRTARAIRVAVDLAPQTGTLAAMRDGFSAPRKSELLRRLVLVVAVAGAFGPILYTALGAAASAAYPHEADLAAFYGRFRGMTSLASLAAQAALAPILLRWIGVGWAFVISP